MSKVGGGDSKNTLYCACSAARASTREGRKLIAGATVFIYDECVELCREIIHEEIKSGPVKAQRR